MTSVSSLCRSQSGTETHASVSDANDVESKVFFLLELQNAEAAEQLAAIGRREESHQRPAIRSPIPITKDRATQNPLVGDARADRANR
jgi:hypothetical protein